MGFWDMITGNSAIQAANAQNQGAQQAMGALNQSYGQAQQYQQPYYQQGMQSLSQLAQGLQGGQYSTTPYNPSNFNFQADPGYQWQLQQGNNAIQSNAAAGGIQLSGASLKALQRYGQGLANQTYNQAFDRFNTGAMNQYNTSNQQAQQRFGNTAQLAGYGQSAANNMSTMASNQGQSLASLYGSMGANTAAGIMGQANQVGNEVGGLLNLGGQLAGGALAGGMFGGGRSFGGAGSAQGAFNNTPYGMAFNSLQ